LVHLVFCHFFRWRSSGKPITFAGAQAFPKGAVHCHPAEMLTIINEMTAESGRILNDPATPYGK
jgi:hypothetical protein